MKEAIIQLLMAIAAISGIFFAVGIIGDFIIYLPTLIREHRRRQ